MELQNLQLPPRAASLLESLRGMSYSLETAVCDVIDNSISAGARTISVEIRRNEAGHLFALDIIDDGCGMTRDILLRAMTLGSSSPLDQRDNRDLGRFGLGLKTASFSQCRRLTVASRSEDGILQCFAWDLDTIAQVDDWRLLELDPSPFEPLIPKTGTVVRWEKLDRVLNCRDDKAQSEYLSDFYRLKKYLSLFFHRFLEDGDFCLRFMKEEITPWDPFARYDATKPKDFPEYQWPPRPAEAKFLLKGFVYPPKRRIPLTLFGPEDEIDLQGFFVYRNKRLLKAGGWLGLRNMPAAPEFRFARIRIDFDNRFDEDWRLDICKAKVSPPREARAWLSVKAEEIRACSSKVDAELSERKVTKKVADLFWGRPTRGAPILPLTSGEWVRPVFELAEAGKLSAEVLKGFTDLLALTHPSTLKRRYLTVPSEEVEETLSMIVNRLSQSRPRNEVVAELCTCRPFSDWVALMNKLESS